MRMRMSNVPSRLPRLHLFFVPTPEHRYYALPKCMAQLYLSCIYCMLQYG